MPSNLTCAAVCEAPDLNAGWMVRLTWRDNSTDETEFHVYREAGGQHRLQAGIARRDQTGFIDRKVVPGETYTYTVLAHRHADDRYSNAGAQVQCRIAAATATFVPTTGPAARGRGR